jgi:FixJ family two-component response regulator
MSPAIARKTLGLLKDGVPDAASKTSPALSSREHNVLVQLVEGLEYKEIAEKIIYKPCHCTNSILPTFTRNCMLRQRHRRSILRIKICGCKIKIRMVF